ncbi:MAG: hypothetical protein H6686_11165 [Fibrobacteria bacterium]|nr:hypothetical protein [Fibrobacteria bacterium]
MRSSITGLDGLQKRLKQMADGAQRLNGRHEVSLGDLFPSSFMARHTRHATIQDLFDASGFKIETMEDLEGVPHAQWDAHIRSTTIFPDWETMQRIAGAELVRRRMGF